MKKLFCLLMALVFILIAGCAKKDDSLTGTNGIVENPVVFPALDEQEEIDVPEVEKEEPQAEDKNSEDEPENVEESTEEKTEPEKKTVEELITTDHPDLDKHFKNHEYIIIQAKKIGESVAADKEELPDGDYGAIKMPMEITKVYRAPFKEGDIIEYWEFNGTYLVDGDDVFFTCVSHYLPTMKDDTEYLMILRNKKSNTASFYCALLGPTTNANYSYVAVSEREAIAQRVKDGTATKYDQLHHALFEGLVE